MIFISIFIDVGETLRRSSANRSWIFYRCKFPLITVPHQTSLFWKITQISTLKLLLFNVSRWIFFNAHISIWKTNIIATLSTLIRITFTTKMWWLIISKSYTTIFTESFATMKPLTTRNILVKFIQATLKFSTLKTILIF